MIHGHHLQEACFASKHTQVHTERVRKSSANRCVIMKTDQRRHRTAMRGHPQNFLEVLVPREGGIQWVEFLQLDQGWDSAPCWRCCWVLISLGAPQQGHHMEGSAEDARLWPVGSRQTKGGQITSTNPCWNQQTPGCRQQ